MKRSKALEFLGLLQAYCQMNKVGLVVKMPKEEPNVAHITLTFEAES